MDLDYVKLWFVGGISWTIGFVLLSMIAIFTTNSEWTPFFMAIIILNGLVSGICICIYGFDSKTNNEEN